MIRRFSMIAAFLSLLLVAGSLLQAHSPKSSQHQTEWVAKSLREMQKIKVGMTRADLLKVFTSEGGSPAGPNRTYIFRGCPLIKVDVEFDSVGRPANDPAVVEANADVIKKMSKPYLEWGL